MSAINQALFPLLLFIAYFLIAIQFLPQPSTSMVYDRIKIVEERSTPLIETIQGNDLTNDLAAAVICREWLQTQSLANLKAISAELCITPVGDKRSKLTWIDAIASTTPENTVLAVNLCYA